MSKNDQVAEKRLTDELGIGLLMARILVNRDIQTPEQAKKFLFPSLKDLHNPFLLSDMRCGVDRVIRAIHDGETMVVFGDYDADGITSTAVMADFLAELDGKVFRYIPDRIQEGYGLNKQAIDAVAARGATLIITVDCGISNHDEIEYATTRHGIDTIVIDHHEIPDRLPPATAVINQNRKDSEFPCRTLAGVGVAFNFLIALRGTLRKQGFWKNGDYPNLKDYLDLVALGTIGDLVPLTDENRIFARIGLAVMEEGKRAGIKALKLVSGIENTCINSESAAFKLIPRLNAAGRIGSPEEALRLLMADNFDEALRFARRLDEMNRERQDIERKILTEILKKIESDRSIADANCFVLASTEWHPGVIGIVASRLVERYYRPVLLISLKDGVGKGSGRSIAEFNLYENLESRCSSLFTAFGGHRYAVGLSIMEEHIDDLARLFSDAVRESVGDIQPIRPIQVDAECSLADIDYPLLSQLEMLAPHGAMNPEPVLRVNNVTVTSHTVAGGAHLRLSVSENGIERECIWFNSARFFGSLDGSRMDILFTPQVNRWRGGSTIQLKIRDAVPAGTSENGHSEID